MDAAPLRSISPPAPSNASVSQPSAEIRPPKRASTETPREPSRFIATADQSPFSSDQVIFCVPGPLAWTRQKLWLAGEGGLELPSTRCELTLNGSASTSVISEESAYELVESSCVPLVK